MISDSDADTVNGVILIVCFGAIYYHWIVYELKKELLERLVAVTEKLAQVEADAVHCSHSGRLPYLLRSARRWIGEAQELSTKKQLAAVLKARQLIAASELQLNHATRQIAQAEAGVRL